MVLQRVGRQMSAATQQESALEWASRYTKDYGWRVVPVDYLKKKILE
jgi:hypothetical protein